jgi:hypothetical protein
MHVHGPGPAGAQRRSPLRAPANASRRPAEPLAPTRASILAMQRAAGNAAVSRMLAGLGHGHDRGHSRGEPGPVQRSTVFGVLRSAGRPLDEAIRSEMEARLGADFSTVRVHADTAAQQSAAQVGARAYTSGEHVIIGQGGADRHTLAHELTHVIQQRRGPVAGTDNGDGLRVSDPSDRFEREAEQNARQALSGPLPEAAPRQDGDRAAAGSAVAVQRVPTLRSIGRSLLAPLRALRSRLRRRGQAPLPLAAPLTQQNVIADLTVYRNQPGIDAELRSLIDELLAYVPMTRFGGAGARNTPARGGHPGVGDRPAQGGYTVPPMGGNQQYGITLMQDGPREDRLATLIHELTHVLNYETYHQDGVVPGGQGTQGLVRYTTSVHDRAADLIELLPGSGLPPGWQAAAREKLKSHTGPNPTTEYDTVLSHLLVWSDQYGDHNSAFHQELVGLVQETRQWRLAGNAAAALPGPGVTSVSASNRLMDL